MIRKKEIIFLFLFALSIRLIIYSILFFYPDIHNLNFTPADFGTYDSAARSIIEQGIINQNAAFLRAMPLYHFTVAFFYVIFGYEKIPVFQIQIFQAIVGSLAVVLLYLISEILFKNRKIAFISALILSIYPHHILLGANVLTEINYVTLLLLSIYLILKFINKPNSKIALLTGISFSLTIMQRSVILLFFLFSLAYILLYYKNKIFIIKKESIILTILFLTLTSLAIRNKLSYEMYLPLGTVGSAALYQGNSENATGGHGGDIMLGIDYIDLENTPNLTEQELADYYKTEAIKAIKNNPIRFITRIPIKWWNMVRPNYANASFINNLITIPIYLFVVIFSIIGMIHARKHKYVNLLYLYIIYHFIIHGIYIANIRYRIAFEPVLIIFAAYGFIKLLNKIIKYGKNKSINCS